MTLNATVTQQLARLDLNLMLVFATVMSERSVTRAAAKLFVGQPAVSGSLGKLRALFGDQLFVKVGRGVEPTPRAIALFEPISAALEQLHTITFAQPTFDPAAAAMTFKLGLSDDNEMLFLPAITAIIASQARGVRVVTRGVSHVDISAQLDSGDIDLGMSVFGPLPGWQRKQRLFGQGYGCLYDPRRVKLRAPLSLSDYVSCKQMIVSFDGELRGRIDDLLAKRRLRRTVFLGTTRFSALPFLLREHEAIASLPELIGKKLANQFGLRFSPLPLDIAAGTQSMAWHARNNTDPAHVWLREIVTRSVHAVAVETRK